MNSKRFAKEIMGKRVEVHEILVRHKEWGKKVWWTREPMNPAREGWVVGMRNKVEGVHVPGGWEDPSHLKDMKAVPCVLVAWWPTLCPVAVPRDGFQIVDQSAKHRAWLVTEQSREESRDMYRKQTDLFPRDKAGRFAVLKFETTKGATK